jgi:hypothetical protein
MPPIKLTDAELDAVFAAAAPLPLASRDPFLCAVANALSAISERGPGVVFRICRELQHRFMTSAPEVPGNPTRWSSRRANAVME